MGRTTCSPAIAFAGVRIGEPGQASLSEKWAARLERLGMLFWWKTTELCEKKSEDPGGVAGCIASAPRRIVQGREAQELQGSGHTGFLNQLKMERSEQADIQMQSIEGIGCLAREALSLNEQAMIDSEACLGVFMHVLLFEL